MRRQYHKTSASNLYASKRIAVALCAAIAMVLGAMSVGATRHLNSPLDGEVSTDDSNNPMLANQVPANDNDTPDSTPLNSSFMSKKPLTVAPASKPTPLLVSPKNKSPRLDARLGPVQTLVTQEKLELDLSVPQVIPVVPTTNANVTINIPEPVQAVTDSVDEVLQDTPLSVQDTAQAPTPPADPLTP